MKEYTEFAITQPSLVPESTRTDIPALDRRLFAGQARLLAERAERGLPIDKRSVVNLLRAFVAIARRDLGSAA